MMQYRISLFAAVVSALVFTVSAARPASAQSEFRAFWADAFHHGFKSPAEIDQLLSDIRSANCNAVIVQMRRRGDTYYPSSYEPFASDADPSFDALAYLIDKAHNGTPRIEVHAWLCTLPIWNSAAPPTNPDHPMNRYPQYLTKTENGATWDGSGYVFDPGHPGALDYTTNVYLDVARRYDVDGIHFDYVRFYGRSWGYNDVSVGRFNARFGRSGLPALDDETWLQWRRDQVTALVRKVYANAIAIKPGIKVSASTIPWGDGPTTEEEWLTTSAYSDVLQDWRAWMEEGILDINVPMCYDRDHDSAQKTYFDHWIAYVKGHKYNRQAVIGPGIYLNSIENIIAQYREVRLPGMYGGAADGICGYSYAVTNKDGMPFSELANALTQPSVYDPDPTPLFATWVPTPDMPWKTDAAAPGHIKGNVTIAGGWADGAVVTVKGPGLPPEGRTMTADGTGFYAFVDLPAGDYTVTASCAFGKKSGQASVSAHEVTSVDFDFPVSQPAPVISNIVVENVTTSGFTVTWDTDIPSTSQALYGPTRLLGSETVEDTCTLTGHSLTVTGLPGFTPCYFQLLSRAATPEPGLSPILCVVTQLERDCIVDNPAGEADPDDKWSRGTGSSDKYGPDYRFATAEDGGTCAFRWRPKLPVDGNYEVYVWYPKGSNRSRNAPFTVYYNGGSVQDTVNQQNDGTNWENNRRVKNVMITPEGGVPFLAGETGYVELTNNEPSGRVVMADAVKFRLVVETDTPTTPTGLKPWDVQTRQVMLTWSPSSDVHGIAGYKIYRDGLQVGFSPGPGYIDPDLKPGTAYTYRVAAYDNFGNTSDLSGPATVSTLSDETSPVIVSGGGWVIGTDGARKNFEINVKYKPNSSGVPEGRLQFSDAAVRMKLQCDSWEWLSVDQTSKTAWLKGTGSIGRDKVDVLIKLVDGEAISAASAKPTGDAFAITVKAGDGGSLFAPSGVYTVDDLPVMGGNIEIHKTR